MKILVGGDWQEGFLDYHRGPDDYRVQVECWKNLERLQGIYFIRDNSLRLLWNYLKVIGPRQVWRKIVSRTKERGRNEKYIACGVGRVVEAPAEGACKVGDRVVFLAPCHPGCAERVVVPAQLLSPLPVDASLPIADSEILCLDGSGSDPWWSGFRGWSSHSGITLKMELSSSALKSAADNLRKTDWTGARRLKAAAAPPNERRQREGEIRGGNKTAVLLGYGNYAKVMILPNISPYVDVTCIHEIDPLQMPKADGRFGWDTAPELRPEENHDVVLIAGYHHTHAPLAAATLRRGACAVVEKPIVTDAGQLRMLLEAMRGGTSGRLFSGFHKRHSPFNARAIEDLNVQPGDPISYHCIVYEVPLPPLHWYLWPNSHTRLISNGCHWIDHFLHLNRFSKPTSWDLALAANGTINCSVALANGAFFTMVLTDQGSERIGLQEHVELRAGGVTVTIVNSDRYLAEDGERIIRRAFDNKLDSYARMYREIGRQIAAGGAGESADSVETSASLVLNLEDRLLELQLGRKN